MPTIEEAQGYARLIDAEVLSYLSSRGISERVARLHRIGKRYGKMLTIPNIISDNGKTLCYGIKWRWLPQYQPEGTEAYRFLPGSDPKSIYNYNVLKKHHDYIVIVESLLDVLMLETQGVVAVAPFGGGAIWNQNWSKFFDCDVIINIGDNDEIRTTNGIEWTPGEKYANNRAHLLGIANSVKYQRVVTTFPPDNYKDITDAYQNGLNVKQFISEVAKEKQNAG